MLTHGEWSQMQVGQTCSRTNFQLVFDFYELYHQRLVLCNTTCNYLVHPCIIHMIYTYLHAFIPTYLPTFIPTYIHTWPELTWPDPTFPYSTMGNSYTYLPRSYLASYPATPSYLATMHTYARIHVRTLAMFVWGFCKLTFLWARSEIRACRVHSHSRALVLRFRRYYSDNGELKARRLACELCCFLRPPVVGTAGMERYKSWSFGCCLRRYQQYVKVNHLS